MSKKKDELRKRWVDMVSIVYMEQDYPPEAIKDVNATK